MSVRFLILASLATASLVFAAAAGASGYSNHGGYGRGGYGAHSYQGGNGGAYSKLHGGYRNNRHSSYSYGYRHRPKGHGYKSRYGYSGRHGSGYVNQGHSGYSSGGCQSVYKVDYWNGHKARIGRAQCYDDHGNAYIVPGSRYLVEHLYY